MHRPGWSKANGRFGRDAQVPFAPRWAAGFGVMLAMLAVGCCTSMQRATALDAALDADNRVRSEPSMRSAAEQRGATLLPDRPEEDQLVVRCRSEHERSCVVGTTDSGRTYRIRDARGKVRLAVPVGSLGRPTARLARRGSKLLVLVPQVTPGRVTSRTACECDRKPHIASATGFVHLGLAFFVDDAPGLDVEEILVPVTEDQIEWECKAQLL